MRLCGSRSPRNPARSSERPGAARSCEMRKHISRFVLPIWLLAVTASCVSPEELRREDAAACAGYGFQLGTDAFATCLQRESLARRYLAAPPTPYWGWGYWGGPWGPYWP